MNASINTTLIEPDFIKVFDEEILCIRNLCISSQAFRLNNQFERVEERLIEAHYLIVQLGYDSVKFLDDIDICFPEQLKRFDVNNKFIANWDEGRQCAFLSAELSSCQYCQDILVDMCPHHDF
jgi:hypothetical protein